MGHAAEKLQCDAYPIKDDTLFCTVVTLRIVFSLQVEDAFFRVTFLRMICLLFSGGAGMNEIRIPSRI